MEQNIPKKVRKLDEFLCESRPASDAISGKNNCSNVDLIVSLESKDFATRSVQFREILGKDLHLSYCESFLPKPVADSLLEFCERTIQYADGAKLFVFGKWHSIPRKQIAFGNDGVRYQFSGTEVAAQKWPEELKALRRLVSKAAGCEFNFALVNRYADGNDCIGEHRDDERELDPDAGIASLSIGQCRDFVLRHETRVRKIRNASGENNAVPDNVTLPLKHGSLLLMRPPTNQHWYHSLPKRKRVVGTRINFTFRKIRL